MSCLDVVHPHSFCLLYAASGMPQRPEFNLRYFIFYRYFIDSNKDVIRILPKIYRTCSILTFTDCSFKINKQNKQRHTKKKKNNSTLIYLNELIK